MIQKGDILVHLDSKMWYAATDDISDAIFERWIVYRVKSETDVSVSPKRGEEGE